MTKRRQILIAGMDTSPAVLTNAVWSPVFVSDFAIKGEYKMRNTEKDYGITAW
ncbi:MAG: hypothetical protein K6G91_12035 [Kiritimatiellae bacterium]|nr:hypothetical protein [Kiritimatiellia bacterium]